jgi:hypothetical protein
MLKSSFNKEIKEDLKKHFSFNNAKALNFYKDSKERNVDNYEIKVFFLYPHSIIQKTLIKEIIYQEYAAYMLNDHEKTLKLLEKYTNSILFINIDTVLSETDWEVYIQKIMSNQITQDIRIGVLSFYEDEKRMENYLIKLMIQCGFIRLKLGFKECKAIMMKALEVNEAKGRRKYIRVKCRDMHSVYISIKINNNLVKGFIYDISSAGFACGFDKGNEQYIKVNSFLDNIQLQLRGILCLVNGTVHGVQKDEENNSRYVIMFEKINYEIKNKIHDFIAICLQESIDNELKLITKE